jgi:hypothetical protein
MIRREQNIGGMRTGGGLEETPATEKYPGIEP